MNFDRLTKLSVEEGFRDAERVNETSTREREETRESANIACQDGDEETKRQNTH